MRWSAAEIPKTYITTVEVSPMYIAALFKRLRSRWLTTKLTSLLLAASASVGSFGFYPSQCLAQFEEPSDGAVVVTSGQAVQVLDAAAVQEAMKQQGMAPNQAVMGMGGPPGKPGERPPQADKNASGDKAGGPGKSPGANPAAENAGASKSILRSQTPPKPANPDELKVAADAQGLLQFQFRDQPWPEVLKWLAAVSQLSLDWQELPGDYINIATQRPYTLEETKDAINRALLLRGFTMLEQGETLTISKTEGINPSLVPRVQPEQLSELPPHSFVRTTFELNWLLAEEVHGEFSSMISKNGKLTPLISTNRIEAMDSAANLREIHEILTREQSALAMEGLAEEFQLQYAKASQVKADLETFLGLNSTPTSGRSSARTSSGGGEFNQMIQMQQQVQQQMQQIQQQMQQGGAKGAPAGAAGLKPRSDRVYIVANERANSLIVHAPPNKKAIITAYIRRVDVPNHMASDFERLKLRTKVFRLASLSPTELVASLTAMDVLEPTTKLQVNEENKSLVAYASLSDQYLIQDVIERLDGSQRSMHVKTLRRLNADAVAGSIRFLMGGDEEKNNSNRDMFFFDPWSYGSRSASTKKESDKMRVTANVQDNQLLLWVNEIELEEIEQLLVKLGELPPAGGRGSTTRVIEASRQPETYEYLKQLKQQWEKISPNSIEIPSPQDFKPPETRDQQPSPEKPKAEKKKDQAVTDANTRVSPFISPVESESSQSVSQAIALTAAQQPDEEPVQGAISKELPSNSQAGAPTISITIDERGNLVLQSSDAQALDRLEQWMMDNRPPRKTYDLFKVKYARASWVCLNLKEYFSKEREGDRRRSSWEWDWAFRSQDRQQESQLGKRPELQFIYDNDTNSIVVRNADDLQRQTIAELIQLWDVPDPKENDESTARFTKRIPIKYTRSELILTTVKEAYRDLLSANDKSFEKDSEEKRESSGSFSYKGKLSLGADEVSNSILVSAEGKQLFTIVCDMIEELDEAAKEAGVIEVIAIGDKINPQSMESALKAILTSPKAKKSDKPSDAPQGEAPQNAEPSKPANGNSRSNRSSR